MAPLHVLGVLTLAVLTLGTLFVDIRAIIRGDLVIHKQSMRNLATFGLGLPMVLNFLPGRTFSKVFFEAKPTAGLLGMAVLLAAILTWRFGKAHPV